MSDYSADFYRKHADRYAEVAHQNLQSVYDKDYRTDRTFQLYNPDMILGILNEQGAELIESEDDRLGGIMHFTDPKPTEHCVFWVRKQATDSQGDKEHEPIFVI